MPQKLYYLTTEITPFANVTPLGEFSAKVPLALQAKGHDIRTIIPKYGYVSERKYILREVIRLREIPFTFDGEEKSASAKSAFIPKTRVQIYFLEDDQWFKPLTNLLYKSKNGRTLSDNGERYGFFGKAVLATLPHLFWTPDIFVCNGWQAAFIPGLYKEFYEGKEGVKTIHEDIIKTKPKEVLVYGNTEKHYEVMQWYFPRYLKERVKNKIKARVITEETKFTKEKIKGLEKKELRRTRFFPKGFTFPTLKYIYSNKVAMISLGKNIVGIVTENKDVAEAEAMAFELLWKGAKQ